MINLEQHNYIQGSKSLKAHARLDQQDKHWTLDPVIIRSSPRVGHFLDVVKTFGTNIAIIGSFVLIAKNCFVCIGIYLRF